MSTLFVAQKITNVPQCTYCSQSQFTRVLNRTSDYRELPNGNDRISLKLLKFLGQKSNVNLIMLTEIISKLPLSNILSSI